MNNKGLSLIEILMVIAIIAILVLIIFGSFTSKVDRTYDSLRKGDLEKVKVAFENYHSDTGCYPPIEVLDVCGSGTLAPYLNEVPCDPKTNTPYLYMPFPDENSRCKGFRVYATLSDDADPAIRELNCDGGCGVPVTALRFPGIGYLDYDYGVSSGVAVSHKDDAGVIPEPSIPPEIQTGFTCSSSNRCSVCQFVSEEGGEQCPPASSGNVFLTVEQCQLSGCILE